MGTYGQHMGTYNTLSRKTRSTDYFPLSGAVASGTRWIPGRAQTQALPPLGPGQVYITRRGTAYHPGWCQVVQRTWEFNRPALQVKDGADVGERRLCRSCEAEPPHR